MPQLTVPASIKIGETVDPIMDGAAVRVTRGARLWEG
jgi:hypothetical protein